MITLPIPLYLLSCATCAFLGVWWSNYIVSRRIAREREAERAELEELNNVIPFGNISNITAKSQAKVTEREPAA